MSKEVKITPETKNDILKVDVRAIQPDFSWNPRENYGDLEELACSILENGVKKALKGRRHPEDKSKFLLIDGHRRYKACMLLLDSGRLSELRVKFELEERGTSEEDRLIETVLSNNSGLPFSMLEYATVVKRLTNAGMEEKEICARLVKTPVFIKNCYALLSAPESVKNLIKRGKIAPTLVLDIFRKSANFDGAVKLIEDLNAEAKDDAKKITKRAVTKHEGRTNSVQIFKKMVGENEQRLVKENRTALFQYCQKLVNGELTLEEMESNFYL